MKAAVLHQANQPLTVETLDVREERVDARIDLVFSFALPAGAYATAVIREFRKRDEADDRAAQAATESPLPHESAEV